MNGVERMRSFCADIGVSPSNIKAGDREEIGRLAKVLAVPAGRLAAAAVERGKGTQVRVGSEWFDNSRLNRQHLRFCPDCIKTDLSVEGSLPPGPWYRSYWLLPQIFACPEHGTRIVEIEQPQKLESNSQDFSAIIDLSLKRQSDLLESCERLSSTAYERYLISRLTGTAIENEFLAALPVETVIVLSEAIGASFSREKSDGIASADRTRDSRARAFSCLESGRDGFIEALEAISSLAPAGSFSPNGTYGRLYAALAYHRNPTYNMFREMIVDHADRTGRIASGTMMFGDDAQTSGTRVRLVANETGAAVGRVKRILTLTGASAAKGGAGLMDQDAAEKARGYFEDAWSLVEARRYLGCSLRVLRTLLDTGMIHPPVAAMPQGFTSRTKVTDFVDRVRAAVLLQMSPTMVDLATAADRADSSVPEIISYAIGGKLSSVALVADVPLLLGLRVEVEEVRQAHLPPGHVTAEQARSCLRLNPTGFAGLVKSGCLKATALAFPRQKWLAVAISEIERFGSQHVTLQECAEVLGISNNAMVSQARAWKLEPAYPYGLVGQKIFLRRAVADFVPSVLIFPEFSVPK